MIEVPVRRHDDSVPVVHLVEFEHSIRLPASIEPADVLHAVVGLDDEVYERPVDMAGDSCANDPMKPAATPALLTLIQRDQQQLHNGLLQIQHHSLVELQPEHRSDHYVMELGDLAELLLGECPLVIIITRIVEVLQLDLLFSRPREHRECQRLPNRETRQPLHDNPSAEYLLQTPLSTDYPKIANLISGDHYFPTFQVLLVGNDARQLEVYRVHIADVVRSDWLRGDALGELEQDERRRMKFLDNQGRSSRTCLL